MPSNIFEQDGGIGQAATVESWSSYILSKLATKAVLFRAGVAVIPTMAKQIHVPVIGSAPVVWADELDDLSANAPDGEDLVLTPQKVGTVVTLSNESAHDESAAAVLNSTGDALVGSVARAMDAALLASDGTGKKPLGIYNIVGAPDSAASTAVDRPGLVHAAGLVRAAGGDPRVAFISAVDHTAMELATDGFDRPLLGSPVDGAPQKVAGLELYPTPALVTGQAIIADPTCIVVALRQDPTVAFSSDAAFDTDGTKVRVTARADVGVRDLAGIALIKP